MKKNQPNHLIWFTLHTEIKCTALSTTPVAQSQHTQDVSLKDCLDGNDKSIGTVCKVTCNTNWKPTQETTTCTLEPVNKRTATWDQNLGCEGNSWMWFILNFLW